MSETLYDQDFYSWTRQQSSLLRQGRFEQLDLSHLIEELDDLGRRDRKRLKSLLRNLIEHLLKLAYWQAERERNQGHWRAEIANFRKQIQDELEDSPSLKGYIKDIYATCYQDGREIAANRSQLPLSTFPEAPMASLEQVLDEGWLP